MILKLKDGDVKIELFEDIAPNHVKRFKQLSKEKKYDGVVFHRVIEGFMAQTGDVKFGNSLSDSFNLQLAGTGGSDYPDLNLTKSYLHEMIDVGRAAQTRGSDTQTTISDTHSVSNGNLDTDNSLWDVPIITTVATTGEGVGDLFEQLLAHYSHIKSTGEMTRRRNIRLRAIFESQLRKQLYTKLSQMLSEDYCLRQLEVIMEGETDPYTAATNCIKHFETNYIGDEE